MSAQPHLIIVTLLPRQGTTGVQAHFNAIEQYAEAQGLQVSVVEPYSIDVILRKVHSAMSRLLNLVDSEWCILFDRWCFYWFLNLQLRTALRAAQGESIIVYAQDTLSAHVAINLRKQGFRFRLVGVVHFNISEASEYVEKGIAREHGMLWDSLMRNELTALSGLDQVIYVSGYMQQIVEARLPEMTDVPNSVISNFILARTEEAGAVGPTGDVIAIGTLEARKNQAFLLRMLAECNAMGKRYSLTLVGDGPDRAALERQSADLDLTGQVKFLGYQPGAANLIPGHRVFVHASRMESQGIVLLEALRAAVPILAAPVGGIPEVIADGQQGTYLNLENPRDAAAKLISLLEDCQQWQRMSQCAQETYRQRFHPDLLGQRWIHTLMGIAS